MKAVLKNFFQGQVSLPLAAYYGDFNVANSIGPHKKKIVNWEQFITLCLTSHQKYKLPELILTAIIIHSKIRVVNSSKKTCLPLIEEFLDLESRGINIEVEGKNETIYFVLTLFFWGFAVNYPRRICKMNIKDFLNINYKFE